jgi:hypothetical protein
MEVAMELSKKTTILLPPDLHEHLTRQAAREGTSLGDLVRRACRIEYGFHSRDERRRAVAELVALQLPVGDPDQMKRESVPTPEELMSGARPKRRTARRVGSR